MLSLRKLLLAGVVLPLAACNGADDVASPGEGVIVVPAPAPTPAPAPAPTPTPTPPTTGPAAECPAGTTNVGTIGNYRSCRLPTSIISDQTLPATRGVAYEINGRVDVGVDAGGSNTPLPTGRSAVLTIQAGAILYGNGGDADNDFLVVNRGSRIQAEGTETNPIIFTARENVAGTVQETSQGLWGGVILAGRAPISNCNAAVPGGSALCENVVEGTGNARYGGEIANDSSGVFRYVQIRYSGIAISANNELQGLTPAGVGSGTVIDHVQVHNSADDGVEAFGGRVNMRYLVMTGTDDDALDVDVGYKGAVQFVLAIQRTGNGSSDPRGLEGDSEANPDALPRTDLRLANFSFINVLNVAQGVLLRGGMDATLVNGIITHPGQCLDIDQNETIAAANSATDERGPPVFQSVFLACPTAFTNDTSVTADQIAAIFNSGTNNVANGATPFTNVFIPTGAAATNPAFNASTINFPGQAFLVATNYIGAVRDANDLWYRGWTCDSATANFGSGRTCTSLPTT